MSRDSTPASHSAAQELPYLRLHGESCLPHELGDYLVGTLLALPAAQPFGKQRGVGAGRIVDKDEEAGRRIELAEHSSQQVAKTPPE